MNSRSHSKYMLKETGFETHYVPKPPLGLFWAVKEATSVSCVEGLQRIFKSTSGWQC